MEKKYIDSNRALLNKAVADAIKEVEKCFSALQAAQKELWEKEDRLEVFKQEYK